MQGVQGSVMSRRGLLQGALAAVGVSLLAACQAPAQPSPTAAPAAKPTEAPKPAAPATTTAPVGTAPSPAAQPTTAAGSATQAPAVKPAAGGFPSKAIEIVVPYGPGGGYDSVARQLAAPMQRDLGQPVVVRNVPGGGSRIGARQFQQAQPDGYTLFYGAETYLFASTLVTPPEGFDVAAWDWVAGVRTFVAGIFVANKSPFKTIQDVLAADKAGQKLRLAHEGGGGYLEVQVITTSSLGMQNVTFVGGYVGTADISAALIRGDIDVEVLTPISSTIQFVRSGDIRPLVVLSPARSPLIPDAATARELNLTNVADLEVLGNITSGIAAVPKTPPDRLQALEQAALKAMKDPGFLEWARGAGVEADLRPTPGKEFTDVKRREFDLMRKYADPIRKVAQGG